MSLFSRWGGRAIRLTDGEFWKAFFGLESHSGETVNAETTLQLDAAWACVKLVSEMAGSLPCMIYDAEGSKPQTDHPLYELLHDQPNADESAVEFWEGAVRSMLVFGEALAEKKISGNRIVALEPMPADKTDVKRGRNNSRLYVVTEDGKQRELPEDRVFHVRNMKMPGSDRGMSTISYARHTLGGAVAAEKTSGKMFANGMNLAGLIQAPQTLNPEQRAQIADIVTRYAGSDKVGKLMVLEAGLTFQQLSLTPEDAQMLETRRFNVEQIARWFGVPPIMIGHASQGQTMWGSGVEQIILQFSKTGLRPLLKRIEGAIRRDLLTAEERKSLKVEFNMEGLLRGDSAARASFYSTMVQNGIMDRNECRALENRPPRVGADVLTAQTNLAPLDKLGEAGLAVQIPTAPRAKE